MNVGHLRRPRVLDAILVLRIHGLIEHRRHSLRQELVCSLWKNFRLLLFSGTLLLGLRVL